MLKGHKHRFVDELASSQGTISKPPASSSGVVVSSLITGTGHGASFDSNKFNKQEEAPSDSISIKIKKSDSQIVKMTISPSRDLVRDLKERAF